MTIRLGTNSGLYVQIGSPGPSPPQVSHHVTLAATVDGRPMSMSSDPQRGGRVVSFAFDGVQCIAAGDHGRGICDAFNCLPTGETVATNIYSPTGPGSQDDGGSTNILDRGTTVPLYRSVSADGRQSIHRSKPAFWQKPGQASVVGYPALNKRLVSEFVTTVHNQVGYDGNDHIISFLTDVDVPDLPEVTSKQILDIACCSIISLKTVFSVEEYVDPATGVVTAYPGFPATSQTQVVMVSSADGTFAMATYQPLGEWGATGYAQCWSPSTVRNPFIRAREVVANIVPGIRRYNAYLCFGTRAQVIAAIQQLHAANITRSTDIVLPDFSAAA